MELLQYWKVIRKSLWLVALALVLGLGFTALSTLNQPPQYESSSTLLLNPSVPSQLVPYVQTQLAANLADSYNQLMHTRSFGEAVVKELPFSIQPEAVGAALTTRLRPDTLFFDVIARTNDSLRAQQLVSTTLKVFLSANAAQQQVTSTQSGTNVKNEMRARLETKLTYLGDQIKSYQTQIADLNKQPPTKDRDDQLLQLRGQLATFEQSETETLLAIAQLGDAVAPNTAIVIDQPLPGVRLSSRLTTNLLLSGAVSLLIGVALAFLRNYIDYTFHSPEQMEEALGVTPLAALGLVGAQNGRTLPGRQKPVHATADHNVPSSLAGHKLVTLEHPKSGESESFRVLRTNLQFSSLDNPVHSLVVTSAGPGEGKSFTASNLAVVMAQAGKRVVLVDADLRKPNIHKLFGLPNAEGFTTLVVNNASDVQSAIQTVPGVDNLAIITSGPLPPNPSEVLNSQQGANVMEQLAKYADIVIYDAPPAGVVADPIILATRVDAVLLVVGAGTTRRDVVQRVIQNLHKVGVGTVLPVLNRVRARELQGYYYYQYYANNADTAASNGHIPALNGQAPARVVGEEAAPSQEASANRQGKR